MNKKEFLKKLEELKEEREYSIQRFILTEIMELAEQLDEPQQPVVKPFIADWFEENKDDLEQSLFDVSVRVYKNEANNDFEEWFISPCTKPYETLTRMKDGYEVEKEPLYVIQKDNGYISYVELGLHDYERNCTKNKELAIKLNKEQAEALSVVFGGEAVER